MKKNEDPNKKKPAECEETRGPGVCYKLKKHPSATSDRYEPRQCPKPPYKKPCPPPVEICKDPDADDICKEVKAKMKKDSCSVHIDDDEPIPIPKPPMCPSEENPCASKQQTVKQPKAPEPQDPCSPKDEEDKESGCKVQEE